MPTTRSEANTPTEATEQTMEEKAPQPNQKKKRGKRRRSIKKKSQKIEGDGLEALFNPSTLTHLKRSAGEPPSEYHPRLRVYLQNVQRLGIEKCEALAMIWRCVHYLGCRYEEQVEDQIEDWDVPGKSYVHRRSKGIHSSDKPKKKKKPKNDATSVVGPLTVLSGRDRDRKIGEDLIQAKKGAEGGANMYDALD